MNPNGKGSGPLHLGPTQPDLPGFVASAARWWAYCRAGALGPGLCVEPSAPFPYTFRGAVTVAPENHFGC